MPQSSKTKGSKAKSAKPQPAKIAAKTAKPNVSAKAKPVKVKTESTKPEVQLPKAAAAAPAQQAVTPNPAPTKPKVEPPHPGKQEQPMWARFNQKHNQKMSKGRSFRHQGR